MKGSERLEIAKKRLADGLNLLTEKIENSTNRYTELANENNSKLAEISKIAMETAKEIEDLKLIIEKWKK